MPSVTTAPQFTSSGTGLMARIILTTDEIGYQSDIASIAYEVFVNGASQAPAVTGSLTVADVMLTALADWSHDEDGKTFHWDAPGTLWPTAGTTYVIVCTFTPQSGSGAAFKLAWRVAATDPRT